MPADIKPELITTTKLPPLPLRMSHATGFYNRAWLQSPPGLYTNVPIGFDFSTLDALLACCVALLGYSYPVASTYKGTAAAVAASS